MVRPWGLLEIVTSKLESESPKVAAKNKADSLSAPHKARRVEAESQGSKVGEIYTQNIEKKDFGTSKDCLEDGLMDWRTEDHEQNTLKNGEISVCNPLKGQWKGVKNRTRAWWVSC